MITAITFGEIFTCVDIILMQNLDFLSYLFKPEDHWSCIAHLSAVHMLQSAVIEEKKFKHSPWVGQTPH